MKREKIISLLENGEYDWFYEELYCELCTSSKEYQSIEEMVKDQGAFNIATYLCEDFPDRYEY